MYKKNEQDIYYLHKLLVSIMFDNENESYKEVPWVFDIGILTVFKQIVSEFVKYDTLSKHIKDNIYSFLLYGRNIKDESYEERINIINEITIILNCQKEDKSLNFYIEQLLDRRENLSELKKASLNDILAEIEYIDSSIYNDFIVLVSHGDDTSEEDFDSVYLPNLIENNYYYESLNVILKECPSLFENKLFISRVKKVLNSNTYIDGNFKKIHKKFKHLSKKYN